MKHLPFLIMLLFISAVSAAHAEQPIDDSPTPYDVGYFIDSDQNRVQTANGKVSNFANHTVVFWINGDADRFRPEGGLGTDVIRLDKLDVAEVQRASRECHCNIVLFVDQRGSNDWDTNSEHFSAKYYVYSNGERIRTVDTIGTLGLPRGAFFEKSANDTYSVVEKFDEVNGADESFLVSLLQSARYLFPETQMHLVYRGHSFALPVGVGPMPPFDFSHPQSPYHLRNFINSIAQSGVHLTSVTFAACAMNHVSMALGLMPYVDYMIGTQINVHETGLTGFSYGFLGGVSDPMRPIAFVHAVLSSMLLRFKTVSDTHLFIRESPMALIDLKQLRAMRGDLIEARGAVLEELRKNPSSHQSRLISARISERYLELKRREGLSSAVLSLLKKRMVFKGINTTSYDFLSVLRGMGRKDQADKLAQAILLEGYSDFSGKSGLNFDVTFD